MPEAPEVKWVFMVVVIGALYWSKKEKKTKQLMTHRDGDPYGNGRDGDYSNSPYTRGPDGKMISSLSIPNPVYGKPRKGGGHNAYNPVASSVPRERPLKKLTTQKEMMQLVFSWPEEKQAEFRSMKSEAEATAYLANEGYTN